MGELCLGALEGEHDPVLLLVHGRDAGLLEQGAKNLASFILALVADRHEADDLFQATCLELWRIRSTFRPGTDFGKWSRTVARHQVQRFWRKSSRELEKGPMRMKAKDATSCAALIVMHQSMKSGPERDLLIQAKIMSDVLRVVYRIRGENLSGGGWEDSAESGDGGD